MTTELTPPFSARSRRDTVWIEEAFPVSARTGLLHLLHDAVDRDYISNWTVIAKELRRIARVAPRDYSDSRYSEIKDDAELYLTQLTWERAYDFCERLYSHIAQGTLFERDGETVRITKAQSQQFIAEEIQRLFEEESLGYEFKDGLVERRGKRHTTNQINKAERTLADLRLDAARVHYSKALRHFRDRENPDHQNTVKEAVCAVEAAAKQLFPEANATTLGDFVKWVTSGERPRLPKTIGKSFDSLYGFRNSGEGVAHGGASGGPVTSELSEYVLAIAASQIILLGHLLRVDDEPPF